MSQGSDPRRPWPRGSRTALLGGKAGDQEGALVFEIELQLSSKKPLAAAAAVFFTLCLLPLCFFFFFLSFPTSFMFKGLLVSSVWSGGFCYLRLSSASFSVVISDCAWIRDRLLLS